MYNVVQHHRDTAKAVGGKFGVYHGALAPNSPSTLISAHDTVEQAWAAVDRYEASDKRRKFEYPDLLK
jgi:hypothetical protein